MRKVLIVEDDRLIAELERDYLEASDYETEIAEDGFAGMKLVRENKYDLVILDECVEEELQSLGMVEPCSKLSACRPNGSIDHELLVLVDDGKLLSSVESVAQRVSERIASPLRFLLLSLSGGTGDRQRDEER